MNTSTTTKEVIRISVPDSEGFTPRKSALAIVEALADHIGPLAEIPCGTFCEAEVTVWENGAAVANYIPWGELDHDDKVRAQEICNMMDFHCGPDGAEGMVVYYGVIPANAHGNHTDDEIIAMISKG